MKGGSTRQRHQAATVDSTARRPLGRSSVCGALRRVGAPYLIHLILVISAVTIAQMNFPIRSGHAYWNIVQSPLVNGLAKWDSGWFMAIAVHGYSAQTPTETAFFPLYPLCIGAIWQIAHAIASLSGATLPASKFVLGLIGIIVSNLALLGAFLLLDRWLRHWLRSAEADRALWLMAVFPVSFFFSAVYSESLFVWLALLVFHFGRRRQWVFAAFAAGLACLTRVIGVILPVCLVLLYWQFHGRMDRHRLLRAALLLIFAYGLAALYPLYLWRHFGQPLLFLHAESAWGRTVHLPGIALITSVAYNPLDWLAAIFAVVSMCLSFRALPLPEWMFAAFGTVVPLVFSGGLDALSMPRLVLVLFPWFAFWAARLRSTPATAAWFAASASLLLVLTGLFANWHWVA
ncbi:MAG: hypothetical protein K6T83_13050 [Alicyclobacillus sp.]|nr:hypothetical protein [Alicyclobacillus sp.]